MNIMIVIYKKYYNIMKKNSSTSTFFIKANQQKLCHKFHQTAQQDIHARILHPSEIHQASQQILKGRLLAFPTQTVYGLGANALNEDALLSIYQTKKRPLTDPIIVHVLTAKQALTLVHVSPTQHRLFTLLTDRFWPGPLTLILPANLDILPMMVTAKTGLVGVRAPKHPYARRLLEECKVPIGAPSANLFSHVSPTEPVHVFNDFFNQPITIVDGGRCEYGVESTVIKLNDCSIEVLREGSFLTENIRAFMRERGESEIQIIVRHKTISHQVNMEAPGQMLKHYAPYLPCCYTMHVPAKDNIIHFDDEHHTKCRLDEVAIISFRAQTLPLKELVGYYFQVGKCIVTSVQEESGEDIFCSKQEKLKMREIYYLLRQCENLNVRGILILWSGEREGTIWDKIFRSTQGKQAELIF